MLKKLINKYGISVGLGLLYILLPSHNSGIDGYAYAASIKWGKDLIWPHHLLYVPLGRVLFLAFNGIEPLVLMKLINGVAGLISLVIFQNILNLLNIKNRSFFVVLVGATYGFMRYSTENETYILPILVSLCATFFFLNYLIYGKNRHLVFSGFLFGIGVLFHQIHGFWFLAFAIVSVLKFKTIPKLLFVITGTMCVTITYLYAYYSFPFEGSVIQFVLNDVYNGQVETHIGVNHFIMTPISFLRTFIQVHGYLKPMLIAQPALLFIPCTFVIVVFISIYKLLKFSTQHKTNPSLSLALFLAFIFHFLFAFYSVGNAEFMVMLPILLILWVLLNFSIPTIPILHLSIAILVWNIVFGLAPAHFLDLDGSKKMLTKINAYPNSYWLLSEPQKTENMVDYYTNNHQKKPIIYRLEGLKSDRKVSGSYLKKGQLFCEGIIPDNTFNRKNILKSTDEFEFIRKNFSYRAVDTINYFGGNKVIYQLSDKK